MHSRQRTRLARQLQLALLYMVVVDMRVAEGVHKVAVLKSRGLRNHHREECIAGYVERHAKEYVGRTLVELARQTPVGHIELEQNVARRQRHLVDLAHIPRRYQQTPRIGIVLDLLDKGRNLVDMAAVGASPRAPLMAVDGTQVAVGVGPLVPNCHLMVVQIADIGVAPEEPQQLIYNRTQVQLLGSQQRKAVVEVEAHLVAEHAARTRTRAVVFLNTIVKHILQKVKILLHKLSKNTILNDKRTIGKIIVQKSK